MNEISVVTIGFGLVLVGIVLALVAAILLATRSADAGRKTRGGGILLIGPIPIIFGTDRESVKILVILAVILIAVVLVASVFLAR